MQVCICDVCCMGLTSLAGRDAYADDHDSNACGPRVILPEEGDIVREIFAFMDIFPWLPFLHLEIAIHNGVYFLFQVFLCHAWWQGWQWALFSSQMVPLLFLPIF